MASATRPRQIGSSARAAKPQAASPGSDFAAHCAELLAPLGPVRIKRMFGGHGIYLDDLFVAIIAGETLYLKADDDTREHFRAAGCREFRYEAAGKVMTMGYWTVPEDAMEAPPMMEPWARLATAAALRARARQKPRRSAPQSPR